MDWLWNEPGHIDIVNPKYKYLIACGELLYVCELAQEL